MNQLQKSLVINAVFSGLSGICLTIFHRKIAKIFETPNYTAFWLVGLVLLFFASTIVFEVFRQRPIAVRLIIMQDFLWVIASAIVIIFQLFDISELGTIIIAFVAIIVLFMGINQGYALRKLRRKQS